jgi:hypothetical protein
MLQGNGAVQLTFTLAMVLLTASVTVAREPLIDFQVLSDLGFRSSRPLYRAINSREEWIALWKSEDTEFGASQVKLDSIPEVEFQKYTLLVASSGTKPNSGYSVFFTAVKDFNGGVLASVIEIVPGPNCPTAQEITHPFAFALTPKPSKHIAFVVSSATKDCNKSKEIK